VFSAGFGLVVNLSPFVPTLVPSNSGLPLAAVNASPLAY